MGHVVQAGTLQVGLDLHSAAPVNIGVAGHQTDLGMAPVVQEVDLRTLLRSHCRAATAAVRGKAVAEHMASGNQLVEDCAVVLGKADDTPGGWRSEAVTLVSSPEHT